jgi:protein SCO1
MRPRTHLTLALLAAVAAAALIAAVAVGGLEGGSATSTHSGINETSPFDGAALPLSAPIADFTLTDQSGRRVSLHDYRGHVTLITTAYSGCGAACVLIAQQIRGALDQLARPPAVLIVSAAPEIDTPAAARSFLAGASLAGRAEYLRGPAARLRPVWRELGFAPASAGRGAFARAATVLLLDARGRKRVIFGVEQLTPEGLAHDIGALEGG